MRRAFIACGLAVLAGCGSQGSEKLPAVCTAGPAPIARALASAPGAVRMHGVSISRCFTHSASSDDVQIVGGSLVAVAEQLGASARSRREGIAALRLGYLIGAARRGAARNGLADELVRRLEQEEGDLGSRSAAFQRGLQAGLAKG